MGGFLEVATKRRWDNARNHGDATAAPGNSQETTRELSLATAAGGTSLTVLARHPGVVQQ
jgi:hypothetical protein